MEVHGTMSTTIQAAIESSRASHHCFLTGELRKPVDIYEIFLVVLHTWISSKEDVRPERPDDDGPFKISNNLWSLACVLVEKSTDSTNCICDL
jgi:hypothetical protein